MDIAQLKSEISKLPEPITEKLPPYWEYWRWDLYKRLRDDNPSQFSHWPCIYHTMTVSHWPGPIEYELNHILNSRFIEACAIPHFGPEDRFLYGQLSMNLIHQAYHIHQWEQATGRKINTLDTIVEFGGGYGAMCLLVHRLGFEGKYIIYDLPEFSLLQEYYLSQFGLLANVEWNPKQHLKPSELDLYMALYSLSEVPIRERITTVTHFYAKSYLFLYSGQWEDFDNVDWFQRRWPKLNTTDELLPIPRVKNWKHTELTHLPDKNNWYSLGW